MTNTKRKTIKTAGDDALFRRFMPPDAASELHEVQTLAMRMSADKLRRFCQGMMNALIVVQDQFRKRFPKEWADWNAEFNDD